MVEQSAQMLSSGWKVMTGEGHKGTFWGAGNVLYFDLGGRSMSV